VEKKLVLLRLLVLLNVWLVAGVGRGQELPREKILVRSVVDGTDQPSYLILPPGMIKKSASEEADIALRPMVVSLHSWSGDFQQRQPELEQLVHAKNWLCLQPNFRGVNNRPEALASPAAQQDILDAVDWVIANYGVDPKRVYLTGNSGGGHMTMLMAAKYPQRWRAASAWVGISDLARWHETQKLSNYGAMIRACCGGAPGESPAVDEQYRLRSPLTFLAGATTVPLDLAAGVHDGHNGSVPIHQTLDAFNAVAAANHDDLITPEELAQLSRPNGRLDVPQATDMQNDASFGRSIYLRRVSKNCRVTIFEGGHEGIASAAMAWFDAHP
jgi:dipeptidyl aminopeptidase/acylaminoacyl peptidase